MIDVSWNDRMDRTVSSLLRDILTVVDGAFSEETQRDAVKHQMKRAIYNSMDGLRDTLVREYDLPAPPSKETR